MRSWHGSNTNLDQPCAKCGPASASLLPPSGVLPSQLPPWLLITTRHTKFDACIFCHPMGVRSTLVMTSKSLTGQMLSGDSLPGVHPFQLPCPEPSPAWHKAGREKRNWRATLSLGLRHCPQPGGFSLLIGGSGSGLPVPSSIGALPPLHPLLSSSLLSPLLLTRCQHLAGSFRLRLSSFVVVIPSACSSILSAAPLHPQGIQTTEHSTHARHFNHESCL